MRISTAITYSTITLFNLALTSLEVAASEKCGSVNDACVEIGQWKLDMAVGLGAKSNPIIDGERLPLLIVPQLSYYGEHFFLENLDFGYTLFEDVKQTLNLIATPGYDRVFFHRYDLQNVFFDGESGTNAEFINVGEKDSTSNNNQSVTFRPSDRERRITYLSGLDWSYGCDEFNLQMSYLYEVTGEHNGNELRIAADLPLIQRWWSLSATLGATWKSAELVDYYYGEKGVYDPNSAFNPFVKLGYETQLNNSWTLKIFGRYERLDNAIVESPIVDEDEVLTFFVGGIYSF